MTDEKIREISDVIDDMYEDNAHICETRWDGYMAVANSEKIVEELLKHYKIVDKDSVVISKEEYERLQNLLTKRQNVIDSYKKCIDKRNSAIKQASKETVDKLITKIKHFLSNVETVVEKDKYSLYPEIGYKCSEVDDFLDELEKEEVNL